MTPLHVAAEREDEEEILEVLLLSGCKVNARNKVGRTSLHVAAKLGKHEYLKILLDGGANPRVRDKFGMTALELARRHNWEKCVDILLYYKPCKDRLMNSGNQETKKFCPGKLTLVSETREAEEHLCDCCTPHLDGQRNPRLSLSQRVQHAVKKTTCCCFPVKNNDSGKRRLDIYDPDAQKSDEEHSQSLCDRAKGGDFAPKERVTVENKKESDAESSNAQTTCTVPSSLADIHSPHLECAKEKDNAFPTDGKTSAAGFCRAHRSALPTKRSTFPLQVGIKGVVLTPSRTCSPGPALCESLLCYRKRLSTWPETSSGSTARFGSLRGAAVRFGECYLPVLLTGLGKSIESADSERKNLVVLGNPVTFADWRPEESGKLLRTSAVLNPELAARAFIKICALASGNTKALHKLCDALFYQVFVGSHLKPEAVTEHVMRQSKCLQPSSSQHSKGSSSENPGCVSHEYLTFLDALGYVIDRPYTPRTFSHTLLISMLEDVSTVVLLLGSGSPTLNKLLEMSLLKFPQQQQMDVDWIARLFLRVSDILRKDSTLLSKFVDALFGFIFGLPSFPAVFFGTRILARMGLLKDEGPVDIIDNLEGPLGALEHAFGQKYFPRSLAAIFVAFLSKPSVQLTKVGDLHVRALKSALLKEILPQTFEEASNSAGKGLKRICDTLAHMEYWEAAYQCCDVFFLKLLNGFVCSPWSVGENILVYLGLLKSENAVEVVREIKAGLKLLLHFIRQDYFSESIVGLFSPFLCKPNTRLASCSSEVDALLTVLTDGTSVE